MTSQTDHDLPIACNLLALEPDVRAAHMQSAAQLLGSAAAEVTELPDGYAFRYRIDQYERVAQFIANERRCCPFFSFGLEVSPAQGPVWLRITGGEGVKAFLQANLVNTQIHRRQHFYFFVEPLYSFRVTNPQDNLRLLTLLVLAVIGTSLAWYTTCGNP